MLLHVDGARIANAAVGLGCSLAELTRDAGVDVLSLGGTKNGMLAGEAVVLFGDARTDALPYVRKQSAQLPSKMRFVSAQFVAMYEGDLWQRCAAQRQRDGAAARRRARQRAASRSHSRSQANEVFALLPDDAHPRAAGALPLLRVGSRASPSRRVAGALGDLVGHHVEDVDALLDALDACSDGR